MSYAIIRNEKLTKTKTVGAYTHNERKAKNHSNKDIDNSKTYLNFYIHKNEGTYIQEFNRISKEYDLKGQIKVTSNITCEMVITSDKQFFDNIVYEESKRYFEEAYECISDFRGLGKENIISAVVHMDEGVPHMHLIYVPVIHTLDKDGNQINKLSCRDFWKGRNSYRELQDHFFNHVKSKGFDLERGIVSEVTGAENLKMEVLKQVTNYDNTKKILEETTLDMPVVPDIKEFSKFMLGRDEKIIKEIIEPKDELIKELYSDNVALHQELSKQSNIIEKATVFENKQNEILANNKALQEKCEQVEKSYNIKSQKLENKYEYRVHMLETEFENKKFEFKEELREDYNNLKKENKRLNKLLSIVETTIDKFIKWVCKKLGANSAESVKEEFERETRVFINPEKQLEHENEQRSYEFER